ncbi:PRC and DUF2382 domain-containing protein [Gordonia sp. TBRC 11910]|uniref:PRC and DUF2382 domain-containing protein n=1 Tax=Gordonia asplenii TaxID=2725283 RepID=A0A848KZG0_9ACTN|nr:PRC and DUF2382 domain-containing protein [Gordonia asplenii]NMO02225.1 PRC and DUF2382 domain-containing protein [Gordonia asplenii]
MTGNKNFDSVLASTVYDKGGDKVGKVEQIYISEQTDEPRWVSVRTGFLGTSKSLVPLAGASHSGDRLDVAVTKDSIKDAPHLDSDGGTSEEEERALLRHYGFTEHKAGWQQYGKHAGHAGTPQADAGAAQRPAGGADREHVAATGAGADRQDDLVRSEERLNVGTQREVSGRARLRKYVVTEEQTVTVPVTHEEVKVVRQPIKDGKAVDGSAIGEEVAEVTLHADRVVASKETVPVERVGLQVNEVTDNEKVSDTVRKERIETDGLEADPAKTSKK